MSKVAKINSQGQQRYLIFCPACKHGHVFDTRWTFNGDYEKPTFRASMLVTTPADKCDGFDIPATRCHSFVTDGKIQFLDDCTHSMRGLTVDLPEVDGL